jgi:hypothetical protein
MSRQNKQAKMAVIAKQITEMHKQGRRGPGRGSEITKRSGSRAASPERRAARALMMAKIRNSQSTAEGVVR